MSNETTPNEPKENNKNKIQTEHLQNLDYFIQNCLNKFKFVDPLQSFYDNTGKDKDLIISHKSTIPDLVIWNKTFNKNECFEDANLNKESPFPRYRFYLRLNKDKDKKFNKDKEKKGKKNNKKKNKNKNLNNNENNDNDNDNDNYNGNNNEANEKNLVKEMNNLNINTEDDKKGNNINPYNKNANVNMNMNMSNSLYQQSNNNNNNNNINLMHYNNNNLNQPNMNMNYNNQNNLNQGFANNNNNMNKQNLNYNNNNNNYQNQMMNKGEKKEEIQAEFLFKLVYMYSLNKGWIVFTTQNQNQIVGYFNSFDLYKFLNEQLKNNNLNSFSVRTVNEPYMFSSENMFIILHKIIPLIIEKNKNELFQKNP